ncbi:MAG TPA: ATP-binding protein [Candidatus Thermoplasmatota archaeon]|nr:ATP-binding protein [Candidatus Thermoplasmatota archaeon]
MRGRHDDPLALGPGGLQAENRELRERVAQLEHLATYADAIIDTGRAPLAVLDGGLHIRTANQAFCRYFDTAPDEVLGQHVQAIAGNRLQSDEFLRFLQNIWNAVPKSSLRDFELAIASREGGHRRLLINARRLGVGDQELILLSFEDVSSRSSDQGASERAEAQRNDQRHRDTFSHTVSHDLRTPLRAISGYSALVLRRNAAILDDESKRLLDQIGVTTVRMADIIDGLLSLSQLMAEPVVRQDVDVTRLAWDLAGELQSRGDRQVRFVIEEGLVASADPTLLGILLSNLFENAWKYSAPRPEAVIEFGIEQRHGMQHFFVRDNGVGFDMADLSRLFLPFQRLEHDQKFAGTGIGLATVRRIAERHGGHVEAVGVKGQGATFYFCLGS